MTSAGSGLSGLERELICSICTEVLYQPVTVLDCLHTFCGSCLKEWFTHQKRKAETSRSSTTVENPYTCPTCRATARDTQRNALVNNLLESFLTSNPSRDRSEDEKKEMRAMYQPGENILQKLDRKRERRHRRDEEAAATMAARERQMIEEARQRSLQETERPRPVFISAGALAPPHSDVRGRSASREREERRQRRRERERQREGTADNHDEHILDNSRTQSTSPPVTSPRHPSAVEARQREQRMVHQASLRSLVSASENGTGSGESFDEARIMQEILAEGLLDGIDVEALTEAEQDMWAERIAELYRARHRRRTSPPSNSSYNDQVGHTQQRSHQNAADRRLVAESEPDRPRMRSRQRSDTTPVFRSSDQHAQGRQRETSVTSSRPAPPSAMHRSISNSSITISHRSRPSDQNRPSISGNSRQSSNDRAQSRTQTSANTMDSHVSVPRHRISSEHITNSRGNQSPRASTDRLQTSNNTTRGRVARQSSSPSRSPRLPPSIVSHVNVLATTTNSTPQEVSNTIAELPADHTRAVPAQGPIEFVEPCITCYRCNKPDIQYDLYKHCASCQIDLCMRCFREGKGCKHWFGFGHVADERFERVKNTDDSVELPHKLTGRQYAKPPANTITQSRTTTTTVSLPAVTRSDPAGRLQEGNFCDRCGTHSNQQFWLCDQCNDGEWGFCKECVQTHHCCTHPLLPVTYVPPALGTNVEDSTSRSITQPQSHLSPHQQQQHSQPVTPRSTTSSAGISHMGYDYLAIKVDCDICHQSIAPSHLRFHCPFHPSSDSNSVGDFDICTNCYHKLYTSGQMRREDGSEGWRRCPLGHRMTVLSFQADEDGGMRRHVKHDLVGGWKMTEEDMVAWNLSHSHIGDPAAMSASMPLYSSRGTWSWREDSTGTRKGTRQRTNAPTQQARFPPEGGAGQRGVVYYSYYPEEGPGGEGELSLPRGAEVMEVEDINGDWLSGVYAGTIGMFPAGFVR